MPSSSSLVPLVRLARRRAWRGEVIPLVPFARCGQASRMAGGRDRVVHVVHVVRVLISWRTLRYGGGVVIRSGGKQAGRRGDTVHVVRAEAGSVLIAGRLVRRNGQAGYRHPCRVGSKQAGACSLGICDAVPSLPAWRTSVRYMDTAWFSSSPWVPLVFFSLISKLGRFRPRYIVVRHLVIVPCSCPSPPVVPPVSSFHRPGSHQAGAAWGEASGNSQYRMSERELGGSRYKQATRNDETIYETDKRDDGRDDSRGSRMRR